MRCYRACHAVSSVSRSSPQGARESESEVEGEGEGKGKRGRGREGGGREIPSGLTRKSIKVGDDSWDRAKTATWEPRLSQGQEYWTIPVPGASVTEWPPNHSGPKVYLPVK
jgi:hypothetical protein